MSLSSPLLHLENVAGGGGNLSLHNVGGRRCIYIYIYDVLTLQKSGGSSPRKAKPSLPLYNALISS